MKKSLFNIDGMPFYEGYTNGNHWNGWACPMFTKETCESICKCINDVGANIQKAFYDEHLDCFFVTDINNVEADNPEGIQEQAEGRDVQTENGILHLYSFGAYNWIWDDAKERFDTPEEFVFYYLKNCLDIPMSVIEAAYEDITERCFAITGKPQMIDVPKYVDDYMKR